MGNCAPGPHLQSYGAAPESVPRRRAVGSRLGSITAPEAQTAAFLAESTGAWSQRFGNFYLGVFLEGFNRGQTWREFFTLERCPACIHIELAAGTKEQARNLVFSSQACPELICARPQWDLAAFRGDAVAG